MLSAPGPFEDGGAKRDALSAAGRSQMGDEECLRIAAFRVHATANQIGILADRARNPSLRRDLLAVRERLLDEKRKLLAMLP